MSAATSNASAFNHGNFKTKLTAAQRQEICYRRMDGDTVQELALEFGVSAVYIRNHFSPMERPY